METLTIDGDIFTAAHIVVIEKVQVRKPDYFPDFYKAALQTKEQSTRDYKLASTIAYFKFMTVNKKEYQKRFNFNDLEPLQKDEFNLALKRLRDAQTLIATSEARSKFKNEYNAVIDEYLVGPLKVVAEERREWLHDKVMEAHAPTRI